MERWDDVKEVIEPVLKHYPEFQLVPGPVRTGTGWEFRVEIGQPHKSPVVLAETFQENIYTDIVQVLEQAGYSIEGTTTDPDGSFVVRLDGRDRNGTGE